ncbi:MAG: hypothetical protein QM679_09835, partial [Patulibacter sp.]
DAALELARAQVAAGVREVACTPHVNRGYPANTSSAIARWAVEFQQQLDGAQLPLRIHAGAEVAVATAIELGDDELSGLHLGSSNLLLLEPPLATDLPRLEQLVLGLQRRGHQILVAHPERCVAFHRDPKLLGALVRQGVYAQVTAGSLAGAFGRTVAKLARTMVDEQVVQVVASDAHDVLRRPPGLAEPLTAAGYEWLTEWACEEVPAALISGEAPSPMPSPPRRRRLFRNR